MKFTVHLLSIFLLIHIQSCKKDSAIKSNTKDPSLDQTSKSEKYGTVTITFSNKVGEQDLALNSGNYVNANSDSFTVSKFKYYISNLVLRKADGSSYIQKESYHLIDQNSGTNYSIVLDSVPIGTYTGVNFLLGVDSTRNTSGAQTGALDPALGMFWSWNQGYIFLMMEGNSPNSTSFNNSLIFHLGGFTPPYNCIRSINPTFDSKELIVSGAKTSKVAIKTDVLKMFMGRSPIKFAQTSVAMGGAVATTIADNCVDMFKVTAIEN